MQNVNLQFNVLFINYYCQKHFKQVDIFPGVFVLLTGEDNIVVDGVLASCYVDVDHDLSHIVMTPMRLFPEKLEWIFGVDKGIQIFVKMLEGLAELSQV